MEELAPEELSAVGTADAPWPAARLDTVLRGMAEFQSVWMGREDALRELAWLAPERTSSSVAEFVPMYRALADHAIANSPAWEIPGLAEVHLALVDATSQWSGVFERLPRTLIHNDFNPRNIAVRGGAEPRLCVFDWEAAAIGVPQRDLAELLTWTLGPDVSRDEVARWVERARVLVSESCGMELDRDAWELGFRASLVELFVDRLAMYALVDHIRPQAYLPRVIRTWVALQGHYPWAEVVD
jgi:hydroxymethylglutaryl-CoA reductase (NADPH)